MVCFWCQFRKCKCKRLVVGKFCSAWQSTWRQDGGKGDFDALAKLEELRVTARSKGIAWLQQEVANMDQDKLRKVASAARLRTHGSGTSMVSVRELRTAISNHVALQVGQDGGEGDFHALAKLEELWVTARSRGMAWVEKKVAGMDQREVQAVAATAGLSVRGPTGAKVLVSDLRRALVKHVAPQAMEYLGTCG
eukprot:s1762_g15.t1